VTPVAERGVADDRLEWPAKPAGPARHTRGLPCHSVLETPEDIETLQELLDASFAGAGPHLTNIIDPARRMSAQELVEHMQDMCLLTLATVTADGRPLTAPVDGYLLRGEFHFSTGSDAAKLAHLRARPQCSATWLPGEQMCVTVHGRAELYEILDSSRPEQKQAMLDYYLPRQGPSFEAWLNNSSPIGGRIRADKLFTFRSA
jgi:general stress protein 26